ncbi:hypothetical protein Ade02nite_66370 [Paractinoplanes deccanensis]|uniref:Uncharacterized protein n=1 Tax=Paractinoplanes deccanensis TaxID=113561 RepID=A0ABQ3YDE5_9ACTN|nr:hypothetical protein Ade02nite_66370 [Actinoplanes deccanensis]
MTFGGRTTVIRLTAPVTVWISRSTSPSSSSPTSGIICSSLVMPEFYRRPCAELKAGISLGCRPDQATAPLGGTVASRVGLARYFGSVRPGGKRTLLREA